MEQTEYTAGNQLTIADLCLGATVSTFEVMDYDIAQYKNVSRWFAKIKSLPGYEEANNKGAQAFKQLVEMLTKK